MGGCYCFSQWHPLLFRGTRMAGYTLYPESGPALSGAGSSLRGPLLSAFVALVERLG